MEKEINLKSLFNVIKRRIMVVAVFTLLAGLVGTIYTFYLKTPLYASSARILIQATPEAMNTLRVIIKEPVVMQRVAQELNLPQSLGALSGQISTENLQGSQIVIITAVDPIAARAVDIVNATATIYKEEVARIMNFSGVQILAEAEMSPYPMPINQNHVSTIIMALLVGCVLSIGLVFLLDSFDDTIKSERDVEKLLGVPVLGSVSKNTRQNTSDKYSKKHLEALRGESIGS
ncbi:YveK family protein [Ectobacillus antri]|uniref:YveK family protein n=1 Tax=Ectobacillus antri TaxID=2486280 RepID=UPI000F59425F|nr:Wzz/FepE/Etk N-terminal domain-containing protein [Ectobacillus antri]